VDGKWDCCEFDDQLLAPYRTPRANINNVKSLIKSVLDCAPK